MSEQEDKKLKTALEKAEENIQETIPLVSDKTDKGAINPDNKLLDLLKNEPGLQARLTEALETGRWLVTVHFQKKYRPEDEHDLHHYIAHKGYPKNDVPVSLKNIASKFIADELPNADPPDRGQWY